VKAVSRSLHTVQAGTARESRAPMHTPPPLEPPGAVEKRAEPPRRSSAGVPAHSPPCRSTVPTIWASRYVQAPSGAPSAMRERSAFAEDLLACFTGLESVEVTYRS
jgi:hypothetical protein